MGYISIADRRTLVSIRSQDRKRSQMIADDRRSVFPYDRRRSQNFLRSAICDPRSSAIIWKPAFNDTSCVSWKQRLLKALELMEQNIIFLKKGTEKLRNCLNAMWVSLLFPLSTFAIHYKQNTPKCQFRIKIFITYINKVIDSYCIRLLVN